MGAYCGAEAGGRARANSGFISPLDPREQYQAEGAMQFGGLSVDLFDHCRNRVGGSASSAGAAGGAGRGRRDRRSGGGVARGAPFFWLCARSPGGLFRLPALAPRSHFGPDVRAPGRFSSGFGAEMVVPPNALRQTWQRVPRSKGGRRRDSIPSFLEYQRKLGRARGAPAWRLDGRASGVHCGPVAAARRARGGARGRPRLRRRRPPPPRRARPMRPRRARRARRRRRGRAPAR